MKYVYVLVSDNEDIYLEQLYVSLLSFQKYLPNEKPTVLVDMNTYGTLSGQREYIKKYANFLAIELPCKLQKKEKSRWLKTSLPKYINDDFLYIDTDTVISDFLNIEFEFSDGIFSVLDKHLPVQEHPSKKYFYENDKKLGFCSAEKMQMHYNSGVILFKNTIKNREFYELWHKLWLGGLKKGICIDQPSFNQANYLMGGIIKELSGEWNCQILCNGLRFLNNSKIIHYFASWMGISRRSYVFSNKDILLKIKKKDITEQQLNSLIANAKTVFSSQCILISDKVEIKVMESFLFRCLWKIYKIIYKKKCS